MALNHRKIGLWKPARSGSGLVGAMSATLIWHVGATVTSAVHCNFAAPSLHCSASEPLSLANKLTSHSHLCRANPLPTTPVKAALAICRTCSPSALCRSHPLLTDADKPAFRGPIEAHTPALYQGAPSNPEWLALIHRKQRKHERSSRLSQSCALSATRCRCESVTDWLKNVQHTFRFPTGSFTLTARS